MSGDILAELDRSLRGPARAKRQLLGEARAGLADATEAYRAAGLDPARAAERAAAEFGTVAQLRPHFQAELDIAQTRHLAWLALPLVPLIQLFWNVIWELNPYPTWRAASVPFLIAASASTLALLASFVAVLVLLLTGRGGRGRRWQLGHRGLRLLVTTGIAAFTVAVFTLPVAAPDTLRWPPTAATALAATALGLTACARYRPRHRKPARAR